MPPLTGRRGAQRWPHPDRGDDGFVRWQAKQRGFGGEVRRARHRGDFSASDGADLWRHRAWTRPFSPRVALFGVLANRVNSDRHAQMLKDALPAGLRWLGHLSGADNIELPNCHLGLRLANKISDLDRRLNRASEAIARTGLI